MEKSSQEPHLLAESQLEPESAAVDISEESKVDESPAVEDVPPGSLSPSSVEAKEEDSATVPESAETLAELGKNYVYCTNLVRDRGLLKSFDRLSICAVYAVNAFNGQGFPLPIVCYSSTS